MVAMEERRPSADLPPAPASDPMGGPPSDPDSGPGPDAPGAAAWVPPWDRDDSAEPPKPADTVDDAEEVLPTGPADEREDAAEATEPVPDAPSADGTTPAEEHPDAARHAHATAITPAPPAPDEAPPAHAAPAHGIPAERSGDAAEPAPAPPPDDPDPDREHPDATRAGDAEPEPAVTTTDDDAAATGAPGHGMPPGGPEEATTPSSPEGMPEFAAAIPAGATARALPASSGGPARRTLRVPSFAGDLALELVHLHKSFGEKHAVDDLSMTVPPGVVFGLVGPNGAGKTTTLSMATGLLRPDAGTARVWGHDVWADPPAAKALMGVLPDGLRLFDRLTGAELLSMVGALRRLPTAEVARRSAALLDALDLAADAHTMVADYSAGMAKKIGLACALIHNPRLLLLDEPFESVDPVSGAAIREILDQFVDAGGTVVLSSHVMELVESLCDAVAVIAEGHVLAIGPLDDVRAGESLQQRFLSLVGAHEVERGSLAWLGSSSASI